MKPFDAPTGIDDFALLRESGKSYIDKSAFIGEIIRGALMTLFPRPRRVSGARMY